MPSLVHEQLKIDSIKILECQMKILIFSSQYEEEKKKFSAPPLLAVDSPLPSPDRKDIFVSDVRWNLTSHFISAVFNQNLKPFWILNISKHTFFFTNQKLWSVDSFTWKYVGTCIGYFKHKYSETTYVVSEKKKIKLRGST